MEFGPRALGGRSILGDARSTRMQSVMNLKIKFRESFRPFAPSVLEERVDDYFEMRPHQPSPYMLLVAPVRGDKRLPLAEPDRQRAGIDKLRTQRSVVPAVTHVDYSARVQTVDRDRHPRYWRLLKKFEAQTGCPVIINTSFNVRGEPTSARPNTPIAASWPPTWTPWCWRISCCSKTSSRERSNTRSTSTWPSFSWIDASGKGSDVQNSILSG